MSRTPTIGETIDKIVLRHVEERIADLQYRAMQGEDLIKAIARATEENDILKTVEYFREQQEEREEQAYKTAEAKMLKARQEAYEENVIHYNKRVEEFQEKYEEVLTDIRNPDYIPTTTEEVNAISDMMDEAIELEEEQERLQEEQENLQYLSNPATSPTTAQTPAPEGSEPDIVGSIGLDISELPIEVTKPETPEVQTQEGSEWFQDSSKPRMVPVEPIEQLPELENFKPGPMKPVEIPGMQSAFTTGDKEKDKDTVFFSLNESSEKATIRHSVEKPAPELKKPLSLKDTCLFYEKCDRIVTETPDLITPKTHQNMIAGAMAYRALAYTYKEILGKGELTAQAIKSMSPEELKTLYTITYDEFGIDLSKIKNAKEGHEIIKNALEARGVEVSMASLTTEQRDAVKTLKNSIASMCAIDPDFKLEFQQDNNMENEGVSPADLMGKPAQSLDITKIG